MPKFLKFYFQQNYDCFTLFVGVFVAPKKFSLSPIIKKKDFTSILACYNEMSEFEYVLFAQWNEHNNPNFYHD
jgi:hypothetical protein